MRSGISQRSVYRRHRVLIAVIGALWAGACGAADSTSTGPQHPLLPSPVSVSYPGTDAFQGATFKEPARHDPANRVEAILLAPGEIREVLRRPNRREDRLAGFAFHVPAEAVGIVELVVEQDGDAEVYLLRAIASGETVGGVVERRWLDDSGKVPRSRICEARIQTAIKNAPQFIRIGKERS